MSGDASLNRRVSRLENDTEAIYELLTEIRSTQHDQTGRLDSHSRVLDDHTRVLDDHTRVLDDQTRVLDDHTRVLGEIQTTLTEVVRRLPEPA